MRRGGVNTGWPTSTMALKAKQAHDPAGVAAAARPEGRVRLISVVRRWRPKRPLVPEAVTRPGAACPAASAKEAAVRRAWRRLGLLSGVS